VPYYYGRLFINVKFVDGDDQPSSFRRRFKVVVVAIMVGAAVLVVGIIVDVVGAVLVVFNYLVGAVVLAL
jgi:hypothetical protein